MREIEYHVEDEILSCIILVNKYRVKRFRLRVPCSVSRAAASLYIHASYVQGKR